MHKQATVLLFILGNALSMPLELDESLVTLGDADIDVTKFFEALAKRRFDQLPDLYNKVITDHSKLQTALRKLQMADVGKNLQSLKRLVNIQLDTVVFRINGLTPSQNGTAARELEQPRKTQESGKIIAPHFKPHVKDVIKKKTL